MNGPNNPIGWCDFTANPITGKCRYNCPNCYAEAIRKRFKLSEEIQYHQDWFYKGKKQIKKFLEENKRPPKIFVGSMHDIFGPWINRGILKDVIAEISSYGQDCIFQFLTQNPARYSEFDWPDNCWLGTTVRKLKELRRAETLCDEIGDIKNLRYLSIEPLESDLTRVFHQYLDKRIPHSIQWVILGSRTPYHKEFQFEWAKEIVSQCKANGVLVWVKQLPDAKGKADKNMNHWPIWARKQEFPI